MTYGVNRTRIKVWPELFPSHMQALQKAREMYGADPDAHGIEVANIFRFSPPKSWYDSPIFDPTRKK